MRRILIYTFAGLSGIFGLITLFLTSSVIFDLFGIRAKEGNYVLLVVWANFIVSLFYMISSYGFVKYKKWTPLLLSGSTIVLVLAFLGLLVHINMGGIFETKTVGAMILRILLSAVLAIVAHFLINRSNN